MQSILLTDGGSRVESKCFKATKKTSNPIDSIDTRYCLSNCTNRNISRNTYTPKPKNRCTVTTKHIEYGYVCTHVSMCSTMSTVNRY